MCDPCPTFAVGSLEATLSKILHGMYFGMLACIPMTHHRARAWERRHPAGILESNIAKTSLPSAFSKTQLVQLQAGCLPGSICYSIFGCRRSPGRLYFPSRLAP